MLITRERLINWAARVSRLAWATEVDKPATKLAIEIRAAVDGALPRLPGKLVRDRTPGIIRRSGMNPIIKTSTLENYGRYVRAKLEEELEEYLSAEDVAEVADLVEICFAAAALHGVGQDQLLAIVRDKRQQRGGFDRRLVWTGNLPRETNNLPNRIEE